jgi:hypothetical protein
MSLVEEDAAHRAARKNTRNYRSLIAPLAPIVPNGVIEAGNAILAVFLPGWESEPGEVASNVRRIAPCAPGIARDWR